MKEETRNFYENLMKAYNAEATEYFKEWNFAKTNLQICWKIRTHSIGTCNSELYKKANTIIKRYEKSVDMLFDLAIMYDKASSEIWWMLYK